MRKTFHIHTVLLSILALSLLSCVREPLQDSSSDCTGREVVARLSFAPQENSIVTTRAAVTSAAENRILNLFVFLFDENGNKLYSQYFDSSNQENVTATSSLTAENSWWVNNSASPVAGGVSIKSSSGSGFKIYMMANLDADMVRVSSDLLSHNINNEQDLLDFSVYLNQEIISRNGYFPMTGMLSDLKIADDGTITKTDGSDPGTMMLRRLDAKVKFIFKTGSRADAAGQKIKSFTAKQWKVLNLPSTSYLVERTTDAANVAKDTPTGDYVTYAPKFFDTEWINFEEFPDDSTSIFTFYMLENRQTPKHTVTSYQDRSRQVKINQTGGYHNGENETVTVTYVNSRGEDVTRDIRVFQNANDFSTYVLVTGTVEMELENDDQGKILGGDVQYLIHLGDWGSFTEGASWDKDTYGSPNNFNTERNTFYTYTVTVNSVKNIRVEVESSKGGNVIENQPGATGQVTIAKEEIAVCDAHYYSKTMTFHAANFFDTNGNSTAGDLTWSVKTPFSDGTPTDPLSPGTLDYNWVHFRLNKKNSDGTYNQNRRKFVNPSRKFETTTVYRDASTNAEGDGSDGLAGYHNDGLMNIVDLVKYIKEQVSLLESYYKGQIQDYDGDFDNYDNLDSAKICFTAFVDEFYYDENPVTHVTSPTLWKSFVNQPDRSLHILCNSDVSKDLESRSTGSVVTIQQHAIQSIFNTDASEESLQSAWGLEYIDEFTDEVYTYNATATDYSDSGNNTDAFNGLYNSVQEWYDGTTSWANYLDFEVENDVPQMQSNKKGLRYICMARNRDNNGDGVIDPDELRWYTASIRQLIGIYVGSGVIDHHSRLYYRSASEQESGTDDEWRQHVISSTNYSGSTQPTIIWGEEGISTSRLGQSKDWTSLTKWSVRCVRNLGLDNPSSFDFGVDDYKPQDYVEVESEGSGDDAVYTFKATHLDDGALRYYTSRELDYHSHASDINRLYKRFEVLPVTGSTTTSSMSFKTVNTNVTTAIDKGEQNPYCPEGYRLPNQMELAMMKYYDVIDADMVSRTYWSLGVESGLNNNTGKDGKSQYGYIYSGGNLSLEGSSKNFECRCVRDIRVD